jgi:Transposase, Mutator family
MALTESAVSELLDAFRAGDGVDLIRDAVTMVLQELIEVEATEQIGAARYERADSRTTDRNGSRPRLLTTPATSSCASPSCARAASSRRSWNPAAASTRPSTPW